MIIYCIMPLLINKHSNIVYLLDVFFRFCKAKEGHLFQVDYGSIVIKIQEQD